MSGSRRRQTPTWPFLLVLVCLFVLSLTAPRSWEKLAPKRQFASRAKFVRPSRSLDTFDRRLDGDSAAPADQVVEAPPVSSPPAPIGGPSLDEEWPFALPTIDPQGLQQGATSLPRISLRATDLGPAMAGLAPEPALLGADGQISVRMPMDTAPLVVMRPLSPAGPKFDQGADPNRPASTVRLIDEPAADALLDEALLDDAGDTIVTQESPARRSFHWTEPTDLLQRLERLGQHEGVGDWAAETVGLIHELLATPGPRSVEALEALERLQATADASVTLAANLPGPLSSELQRAVYALRRRMAVWIPLVSLPGGGDAELAVSLPDPERLALCLTEVEAVTARDPAGGGWRDYVMFDALERLAAGRGGSDANATRLLAQRVLARLTASRLSKSQRRFVADETLSQLAGELRTWAAGPVEAEQILAHVEAYENSASPLDGRALAEDLRRLAWSPLPELQSYGKQLEQNYRNANVRLVLSEQLLSRMMPPQDPRDESVRETILGAPTRGRSRTETEITARLIPDARRLRFLVEANGRVSARTHTRSGPATMYSNSNSTFHAVREMEMTLTGLQAREMVVSAESRARLRDVATSFDGIPLISSLVGNYARQQYGEKRSAAERELERIVAQKAIDNIAAQSAARVAETNRRLQEHVLGPLDRLQIEPALIEAQTSDQRLTMRLRLAADEQLGAHTPRPRAPSDSLLSAQIHESAINNFLERIGLGGRLLSERSLYEQLASTFNIPVELLPADLHDNVLIRLQDEDPICVRFNEGRIMIELHVDELHAETEKFRDFTVRAFYRPDPDGRHGELMRDGTIHLIGRGLRPKAQIALRGMFSKTFSKDRRLTIVPAGFIDDPRMAGIQVTQWAIADGWIGIAVADVRAGRSQVAQSPGGSSVK